MSRRPDSTLPSRRIASVVLISPGAALLAALESVAQRLDEAPKVKTADLKDAATVVAEWRPFALLVPSDVHAFDPAEFQALARDVGAEVIVYDAEATPPQAAARLLPGLRAALLRWSASPFAGL